MQPSEKQNTDELLDILRLAVDRAAESRYGSFTQRNPLVGKMVRCPHCRVRRRQNQSCCNAKYQKAGEDQFIPTQRGRKNPRLTRNRPPLFEMRQRLLELEANPDLIGPMQDSIEGLEGFWTPQAEVPMQHLATFVERAILRRKRLSAKRKRQIQKLSRRINRQ